MGNLMTFMQRLKMFMKRKENRSKFNKDKFLSDSDKEKFEQLKQTFNSATFSDETRKAFKKAISELIPVISDESKLLILDEYMFYMDFKDISILLDSISSDEIRAEILKKHVMSLSPSQRLSLAEPISSNDLKLEIMDEYIKKYKGHDTIIALGDITKALAESVTSDEKKISLYEKNKENQNSLIFVYIADSLSPRVKLELIKKYEKQFSPSQVIFFADSIVDDELKIAFLQENRGNLNDIAVSALLDSLSSKEAKLKINEIYKDIDIDIPLDLKKILEITNSKKYDLSSCEEIHNILTRLKVDSFTTFATEALISQDIEILDDDIFCGIWANGEYFSTEFHYNNFERYLKAAISKGLLKITPEETTTKLKQMIEIFESNQDMINNFDLRMLDEKYIKSLGIEKITTLSSFRNIQNLLLSLDDSQYDIFLTLIDKNEDNWQILIEDILRMISSKNFEDFLLSLSKEDLDKHYKEITSLLINGKNFFNIKTIEEMSNIENIQDQVYSFIQKNDVDSLKKFPLIDNLSSIEKKKFLIIQRAYGHNIPIAQYFVDAFGKDIDSFKDPSDKYLVDYIKSLKLIMNCEDEEILDQILKDNNIERTVVNFSGIIEELKAGYLKQYNNGLLVPDELTKIKIPLLEGFDVRDAGVDFKVMLTSVAAFQRNFIWDYYEDWNRKNLSSQAFCASYIRNDMLATAPIHYFCYGFSSMGINSLSLLSPTDMNSYTNSLTPINNSAATQYLTPDNLINYDYEFSHSPYNEFVFKRLQEGKRKQPDYLILFKEKGELNKQQVERAKLALTHFKENNIDLPVVIIDKDECEKSEKRKISEMISEYDKSKDLSLLLQIKQKIRTNTKWNNSFSYFIEYFEPLLEEREEEIKVFESKNNSIDMYEEKEKEEKKDGSVNIEDLKEIDKNITDEERKIAVKKILESEKIQRTAEKIQKAIQKETDDKETDGRSQEL